MKKSLFALLAIAAIACAAVATTMHVVVDKVSTACTRAWHFVVDFAFGAFDAGKELVRNLPGPAVALIAAKQFHLRQVKRERPQLAPQWSMCPST